MAADIWSKIKDKKGQSSNLDEKLLRRRKAMVTGIVVLTIIFLIGFIFGSWKFLQNMGSFLEEELGQRLLSVATLTADIIETESRDLTYIEGSQRMTLILPTLQEVLTKVHQENQLQGVYLVDESYQLIASSPDIFAYGDKLTFLEEDVLSITTAAAGVPAVAPMQLVAGNRFKSAYAPVFGAMNEVQAIVVVQASADFFDLLGIFQRGLIFGGLAGLILAVLFSVFLFWAIALLIKTHESMRKTERLAAMGQMAAAVAHEIRNPLGIIKSTADVLKSKYNAQEEADELFEFIPSEVRRLNRLVSDFLTFARDRDLTVNATDLRITVEKTLGSLEEEISQAQVKLETEMDTLPAVDHDEDAINQVMLNLTLNAIQSMNGGGTISVRMKNDKRRGRSMVKVEVEDTGCGFDADLDKIFEPFYTTKTSGSGLGLAICKRLVEKHGGWIDVESEKDKGTKLRFYLPVK